MERKRETGIGELKKKERQEWEIKSEREKDRKRDRGSRDRKKDRCGI